MSVTPFEYNPADFGPVVASTDVDQGAINTIRLWIDTYMTRWELERNLPQHSLPRPVPASISNMIDPDELLDHQLPAILVSTATTVGTPEIMGDGSYRAIWLTEIQTLVRGQRGPETRTLASTYEACVRWLLTEQAFGPEGIARRCRWGKTQTTVERSGTGRYLAKGVYQVQVFVEGNMQEGVGPTIPDAFPYSQFALVQSVTTDVEGVAMQSE